MTMLMSTLHKTSLIWKTALAAGLAWHVAGMIGAVKPYFAPLAAILCLQVTVEESLWRGYQRVLGIVVGVVIADLTARYLGVHGWSIAALVLVGTGLATWLRLGVQAIPQVGVSAMMVLTIGGNQHQYAAERVVDTLLGAGIAVLVNMLVLPPDYRLQALASLRDAADGLAGRMTAMALWLQTGADPAAGESLRETIRSYVLDLHRAIDRVGQAQRAFRYSPLLRDRQGTLGQYRGHLMQLRQGYAHTAGMMRTLLEWQQAGGLTEAERLTWASRMLAFSSLVKHWDHPSAAWVSEATDALPAVLAPLRADLAPAPAAYALAVWNDARQLYVDLTGGVQTDGIR